MAFVSTHFVKSSIEKMTDKIHKLTVRVKPFNLLLQGLFMGVVSSEKNI